MCENLCKTLLCTLQHVWLTQKKGSPLSRKLKSSIYQSTWKPACYKLVFAHLMPICVSVWLYESFSIQSSFDSAGPGWVMEGSADSEAVASVVQMMALLWGQELLHGHYAVTPHPALFPISQHVFESQLEASFEIYLCHQAAISRVGTRSGLQLDSVDWKEYRTHIPR